MKKLFKLKYPKLLLLIIIIIISYYIFKNPYVKDLIFNLGSIGYLSAFFFGILFSFGFSAPISVGFFVSLNPENLFMLGIIGGFGALIGDLFIFKIIKLSFKDEFSKLKKTYVIKKVIKSIESNLDQKIKLYLMYIFAGILIASPLPDEAGVIMLAGLTKIKTYVLAILSFILNTIGIMILLKV
jgi:hypothetical protein